jgi:hypothetical protein
MRWNMAAANIASAATLLVPARRLVLLFLGERRGGECEK